MLVDVRKCRELAGLINQAGLKLYWQKILESTMDSSVGGRTICPRSKRYYKDFLIHTLKLDCHCQVIQLSVISGTERMSAENLQSPILTVVS